MRRALSLLLATSLALAPAVVARDAAASEADAKDLFAKGRELRQKGDCASAVPLFKRAYELHPQGLGSLRNLAECEEKLGLWASARRDGLDLKRAVLVAKEAKYQGWDADADAAAARLAPKVAQLVLEVRAKSEKGEAPVAADGDVKVLVNGQPIDLKLLDVPLDRDPGTYVVRVEGGKAPVEQSVTVAAGQSKTVKLVVELPEPEKGAIAAVPVAEEPTAPIEPAKPEAPTTVPEAPTSATTLKTAGWVAIGVGGAALVGTALAIGIRQGALSDLKDACPDYESGRCTNPAAKEAEERGSSAATWANVFGATTLVGLGAGVALLIMGANAEPRDKTTSTVRLSPWAGSGAGGALLWGSF